MCQREILVFLKNNKGEFYTTKDIAKKMNISLSCVVKNMKNLRKYNIVKWQRIRRPATSPVYIYGL